ncbi:Uncharacterised protein [Mycobacteroides abscessus subsp. abscessus]|nr:Uncharacterised protein [Mycobacteroides abscessus subsp. abscessus]
MGNSTLLSTLSPRTTPGSRVTTRAPSGVSTRVDRNMANPSRSN